MAVAVIEINAVAGSRIDLEVGTLVQLNAQNAAVATYLWEFLDVPRYWEAGVETVSASTFSANNIRNPTFTPDQEGTYLIRLTLDAATAVESQDQVIAAVVQSRTGVRIPAATETTEHSTARGWAVSVNRAMQEVDRRLGNPDVVIGTVDSAMSRGRVCSLAGGSTRLSGAAGEFVVPQFSATGIDATIVNVAEVELWICCGDVFGGATVGAVPAELGVFRRTGIFGPSTGVPAAVGDPVYLSDTGVLSLAVGTFPIQVGAVVSFGGGEYYTWFTAQFLQRVSISTQLLIDATTPPINNLPFAVYTKDLANPVNFIPTANVNALHIRRFGAGSAAPVDIADETGATLTTIDEDGGITLPGGRTATVTNIATPAAAGDAAPKDYTDNHGPSILTFGNTDTGIVTGTVDPSFGARVTPAGAPGATMLGHRMPKGGTLQNLYIRAGTAPAGGGGDSQDYTVYVNGAVTGVTCNLAVGATTTQDAVNTVAVAQGDYVQLEVKSSGGVATGALDMTACIMLFL